FKDFLKHYLPKPVFFGSPDQEADEDPVTSSHSLMSVFALDSPSSSRTPQLPIASACLPTFQRNYGLLTQTPQDNSLRLAHHQNR
ncbi:hypothetical protein GOODEAATRI_016904, partial [Goodea atripinnis]